ncbi:MAG: desulfoferrodoxin [Spirochaetota bacterium]
MERLYVYKCDICGNIVELMYAGGGELVCCGEPMKREQEKTQDTGMEKHVPVIEKIDGGVRVTVGSTEHPMTNEHYIQWIEVLNGDYVNRKYLTPSDKPMAEFCVEYSDKLVAREYCNIHGHWKTT